jgi:hypothetical protein
MRRWVLGSGTLRSVRTSSSIASTASRSKTALKRSWRVFQCR